ncbi:MAG TPA: argininosuccinate lyase [Clostridia bacterium]|nr:argininosuccinate lyase [Clostridia bacterium]
MEKMWAGRFKKELSKSVNDFNSSIAVDCKMYAEDIAGSIAHAEMLCATSILPKSDVEKIVDGLAAILSDIQDGTLEIDKDAEDIHMFVEAELTRRIGDVGKKLHTARSRNDQVALDTKLYVKSQIDEIVALTKDLLATILKIAEEHKATIMCGYTHLQKAQPITFAEHILAYANMLSRDITRLYDCKTRMNLSPLGCCALAGTTYPIDRQMTAKSLGFDGVVANSLDGVSDRDYCIELASNIAILMMHLSRFSEEIVLWCSWEFKYIELDDAYATGSSIMPQKKNPDIAELVRGKTGRTYGNLIALLTIMKALPLAYNKDMQEDKEALFDSVDTAKQCLPIFTDMLSTMTVLKDNMAKGAEGGFINATDCADYLTKLGVPFRTAYKTTGNIVAYCIDNGKTLNSLTLAEYKTFDSLFEEGIYSAIDMKNCVERRNSEGAPSLKSVEKQIEQLKGILND